MHPQIFGSAFLVFGFWWCVLGGLAFFKYETPITFALRSSLAVGILCAVGMVCGSVAVLAWLIIERRTKQQLLVGDNVRGLQCSIGEVPMNAKEPARAADLPVFAGMPDVPDDFYPQWLAHYEKSHPAHVALVKAMLQIYELNKKVPATHIKGGHGGRTLLQHSLLVAYQMQQIAVKWTYTGLRDRTGKKVILKLRDEHYKFDPMDPMVLITGLAHDIGKIEAFIYDTGGEIIGSRHEHDLTGARMLARLPEIWDIPDDDRQAVLLSIAHYHHPMELPLSPDRRAIDDRTIALMELLIKADFTASAIERKRVVPTEADYEREMDERQNTELTDDVIWEAFLSLIEETGRINSPDRNYNLGTLCQVKSQNSSRLVLHEIALRGAMMARLGLSDASRMGDSRAEITIKLLQLMDQHQVLVKTINGVTYNADSALWKVGFYGKKTGKSRTGVEYITGWPAAIIVLPSVSKYVESLPTYHWMADVERGTMGKARAKKEGAPGNEVAGQGDGEGANQAGGAAGAALPLNESSEGAIGDVSREVNGGLSGEGSPEAGASGSDTNLDHESFNGNAGSGRAPHPLPQWDALEDEEDIYKNPPPEPHAGHLNSHREAAKPSDRLSRKGGPKIDLQSLEQAQAAVHQTLDQLSAADSSPNTTNSPASKRSPAPADPILVEPMADLQHFVVPVAAQAPAKLVEEISPYTLKSALATVLKAEALPTTYTGSGTLVYLVPTLLLIKHVPEVNWALVANDIVNLAKTDRGRGFGTIEADGQFFLFADAQMMKSFMETH